jgi:hypothetical protein
MTEPQTQLHRPMYGESGYERNAADAYWTPEWCVDVLLKHVSWINSKVYPVWEPACGTGNICRALLRNGYSYIATDLHSHGFGAPGLDFFSTPLPGKISAIITNPPYEFSDEFVGRAIDLMIPVGGMVAMLLRNEWDSASSRTRLLDRLTLKLVLTKRPRWSTDDKASPRHNFAWFVWDFSQYSSPRIAWDKP